MRNKGSRQFFNGQHKIEYCKTPLTPENHTHSESMDLLGLPSLPSSLVVPRRMIDQFENYFVSAAQFSLFVVHKIYRDRPCKKEENSKTKATEYSQF